MARLLNITLAVPDAYSDQLPMALARRLIESYDVDFELGQAHWTDGDDADPGPVDCEIVDLDPAQPDPEIEAMATIVRALRPLDRAQRSAVVAYLLGRYNASSPRS